ncbi:MAG: hypothetical protein DRI36_00960 [Caldiserica bacterium]|nr:MAG: hypothetical protein DRI36_00960 [Caldisericota bacterium]
MIIFLISFLFTYPRKFILLDEALSINGPSGGIITPSRIPLEKGKVACGIHNYMIKFAYSPVYELEFGFSFDSKDVARFDRDTLKRFNPFLKYRVLKENQFPFSLSLTWIAGMRNFYIGFGKYFYFLKGVDITVSGKFYKEENYKMDLVPTVKFVIPYGMFLIDLNDGFNFGFRIFTSRFTSNLKFDLFIKDIKKGFEIFDSIFVGFTWNE